MIRPGDKATVKVGDDLFEIKSQNLRWQREAIEFIAAVRSGTVEDDCDRFKALDKYCEDVLVNEADFDRLDLESAIALVMGVALKVYVSDEQKKSSGSPR